ncbi:MAG: 3-methyl-2-oxobutanoate hydroxymethyltransferase [Leptospiraceae bacterium]|nr:3-methyl-2-oxobutanoate hydroxymethyltransferase [Leptospiraceae bacterium]
MPDQNPSTALRYPAHWLAAKASGRKLSVLTCYDAGMAGLLAQTDLDAILVGDSLAMVVQGHDSTLPVTLDEMTYHCRMVRRGAPDKFIIGDLPFGSFQVNADEAVRSGLALMKAAAVDAVKLEGASPHILEAVQRLKSAGVPVVGHIGLTPQSFREHAGFKLQGKTKTDQARILAEARALQTAGAFAIVLELMPSSLAAEITRALEIVTIGIGAGPDCDAQVLVLHDLLGLFEDFKPRHVKHYATLASVIRTAVNGYHNDVHQGRFPDDEHSFA